MTSTFTTKANERLVSLRSILVASRRQCLIMMSRSKAIVTWFCVLLADFAVGGTSNTLKVQLNHGGILIGRHLETTKGRHIRSFLGVPFAKPPVEELRFEVSLFSKSFRIVNVAFQSLQIKKNSSGEFLH